MRTDQYGQLIFSELDICNLYLQDADRTMGNVLVESGVRIDQNVPLNNPPKLTEYQVSDETIEQFDTRMQQTWKMPREYVELDIAQWVLEQCQTDAERQRVGEELMMYLDRDLFTLLQYLKYFVDTMRANGVVLGVGRGSSVASYVLYLIGVHRINSLYFDLDIKEFLR
jgi:DNA polymerase III alpha subunit